MGRGKIVLFTSHGEVLRSYFPDATTLPDVADMMQRAAQAMAR